MSTIVVVEKDGKIAIGADSLIKSGYSKQSAKYLHNTSKLVPFGDNTIAIVGYAAWDLILREHLDSIKEPPSLRSDLEIFTFARELHTVLKEKYFINPKEEDDDPVESSQMDCLVANSSGIYALYALRSVAHFTRFYALGAGFKFALGAMFSCYESADFDAERIARKGLSAAAEFDDSTEGPFDIKVIQKES